jgi:hypothetical protein
MIALNSAVLLLSFEVSLLLKKSVISFFLRVVYSPGTPHFPTDRMSVGKFPLFGYIQIGDFPLSSITTKGEGG